MIVNKFNPTTFSAVKSANILSHFRLISSSNIFFQNSEDSGNDGTEAKKPKDTPSESKTDGAESKKRKTETLNEMLKNLAQKASFDELPPKKNIGLAQPRQKQLAKRAAVKVQAEIDAQDEEKQPLGVRLESAAKKVAKVIGGDEAQTESELLNILLSGNDRKGPKKIEDILKGMKAEKTQKAETTQEPPPSYRRSEVVRESLQDARLPQRFISKRAASWNPEEAANLFGEEPLGIFPKNYLQQAKGSPVSLPTWNAQFERQVRLSVTHSPKNYFEELIQWTKQGKLWHFPIDNEQGMDEEKETHFTEHVMLEDHLEPWCPPKGPVRHFMELVCVGLSKSPYYTVQEKIDHIHYYREYLQGKNDILRDTGCGEILDITPVSETAKETEKTVEA